MPIAYISLSFFLSLAVLSLAFCMCLVSVSGIILRFSFILLSNTRFPLVCAALVVGLLLIQITHFFSSLVVMFRNVS